jgi:hypothetical protein
MTDNAPPHTPSSASQEHSVRAAVLLPVDKSRHDHGGRNDEARLAEAVSLATSIGLDLSIQPLSACEAGSPRH